MKWQAGEADEADHGVERRDVVWDVVARFEAADVVCDGEKVPDPASNGVAVGSGSGVPCRDLLRTGMADMAWIDWLRLGLESKRSGSTRQMRNVLFMLERTRLDLDVAWQMSDGSLRVGMNVC